MVGTFLPPHGIIKLICLNRVSVRHLIFHGRVEENVQKWIYLGVRIIFVVLAT